MADKKISELTELTTPDGTEELVVNDSGVSKKVQIDNLIADNGLSGDKIDGGTISNFTSTGIDDNATSTAITIDASENVNFAGKIKQGSIDILRFSGGITSLEPQGVWLDLGGSRATTMRLLSGGAEKARISSVGLTFNGDTAAANALDDYEEGTWTPVDINGVAYTSDVQATYTKIGRWVYINFDISSTGSTSGIRIVGLPFTALSSTVSGNWVVSNGYAHDEDVCGHINASTNSITMFTGTLSYTLNGRFIGSGSYYA